MAANFQEAKASDFICHWHVVYFAIDWLFIHRHHPKKRQRGLMPSFLLSKDAYNNKRGYGWAIVIEPAKYDITIYQGATFDLLVQYKDNTGLPVNMSGYTIAAKLFNRKGTAKLADFQSTFVAQASGVFRIKLEATVTSGITEQGQYDVLLTDPNLDKFYLLEGTAFWQQGFSGV